MAEGGEETPRRSQLKLESETVRELPESIETGGITDSGIVSLQPRKGRHSIDPGGGARSKVTLPLERSLADLAEEVAQVREENRSLKIRLEVQAERRDSFQSTSAEPYREKPDLTASSLLVVILDTNPVWWGEDRDTESDERHGTRLSLSRCVDAVMVFANAHLMLGHHNKVAVIAGHTNHSEFLYPMKSCPGGDVDPSGSGDGADVDPDRTQFRQEDGKYELFGQVNSQIQTKVTQLVLQGLEGELYSDSMIAGPLALALCYIHRMEKECEGGLSLTSRILVIKGSEDNPAQYMNFMNAVFTAQKQNVVIDACILDNESGLLQQACDITGGIYLKIPQMLGLLQYLLWVFLPHPTTRSKLILPPKDQVDYRAACFCHRNLVDVGYVCSVCLSIFCSFSPICSTCQTTFKFLGPPKLLKKKSKKTS